MLQVPHLSFPLWAGGHKVLWKPFLYSKGSNAWFTLNFLESHVDDWPEDPKQSGHPYKFQGKAAVRKYFTENPEHFDIIHKIVVDMFAP